MTFGAHTQQVEEGIMLDDEIYDLLMVGREQLDIAARYYDPTGIDEKKFVGTLRGGGVDRDGFSVVAFSLEIRKVRNYSCWTAGFPPKICQAVLCWLSAWRLCTNLWTW
jgi:hypothetical protein